MLLKNSAEGGADTATVTTANSGGGSGTAWDNVTIGTGGAVTFDNDHVAHGTLAYKFVSGSTTTFVAWTSGTVGTLAEAWGREYVYLPAHPVGGEIALVRLRLGTTQTARIVVTTAGKLMLRNSANSIVATSATSVATGQWVRIEWHCIPLASGGTIEARLFNTADATTPDETIGSTAEALTAGLDAVNWGPVGTIAGETFWMDSIQLNDTGWPGPDVTTVAVGRATTTATARPVTAARTHTAGRAVEADTARPVTAGQIAVLGLAECVSTAQPVTVTTAGGMVPMPSVVIEVAFATGATTGTWLHLDDPTRGRLDVATLGEGGADDPVWVDVTPWTDVEGAQISTIRGSTRVDSPMVTYDTGTATIPLDNSDRRFDPYNLDGPYVDPISGRTRVTAMRAVRIRAVWADIPYELWRGTADEWDIDWDDPDVSTSVLTASDGFKVLAGVDRTAVAAVGTGEATGARISRILDSAGWPAADRDIAVGDSTVQATTLEGSALVELQQIAATEVGELYVDGGGRVVFRNRHALLAEARSTTSQAVFGDGDGELPYIALGESTDDAMFFNDVRVTRTGGTEQTAQDLGSQAMFYRKTYRPGSEVQLETDASALGYAEWLLHMAAELEPRFTSLTIRPTDQPADLWPQALGRQIGDRITIRRRPPGGGAPIEMDVFIRGIEHRFAEGQWETTWQLQSARRHDGFLVLDDATLGRLDQRALAY